MQIFGLKNKILSFVADGFRNVAELLEAAISLDKTSSSERENKNDIPTALEDWLERTASVRNEEWMGSTNENLPNLATDINEEIDHTQFDLRPKLNQQEHDLPEAIESDNPRFERKHNPPNEYQIKEIEIKSEEKNLDTQSVSIQKQIDLQKLQEIANPTKNIEEESDNPRFVTRERKDFDSSFVNIDKRKRDFEQTNFSLFKTKGKKSQESKFRSKIPDKPKRKIPVDFKLQSSMSRRKPSEPDQLDSLREIEKANKKNSQIKSNKLSDRKIDTSIEKRTFKEKTRSDKTSFEYVIFNEKTYSNETPSKFSKHKSATDRPNKFELEEIGKKLNSSQNVDLEQLVKSENSSLQIAKISSFPKKDFERVYSNQLGTFRHKTKNSNEQSSDKSLEINNDKWIELPKPFERDSIGKLERQELETQQIQALEREQIG